MSYKYGTDWHKKRHIVICTIILVLSLIFVIGGGILFGFLDLIKPFNVLPIATVLVVLGAGGAIATFVILMCLIGDV